MGISGYIYTPQPWLALASQRLYVLKMKKITSIEVQKKNPNRVNIYLDDQFSFGLSRIVAAWLSTGELLSDEKILKLQNEDAGEVAMQKALRFLGYRARSTKEVRANLEKHEIPAAVIESVLERLHENRLLNDQEFAQAWVENRNTFRPRSRRVLAMELRRKGLDDEAVEQALEGNVDENNLALAAARKHVRKVQGLAWPEFRNKLAGFLGRRGFSYGVISPVLRLLWDEIHSGSENIIIDNEEVL
jgi:regulatory protein